MCEALTQPRIEAAYRVGHRVLNGSHAATEAILESSSGPIEACLVSVSDAARHWIVGLRGESWVGRRLAKRNPTWPTDTRLFEGRQFSYHCRPSGVWLEDMHTTNGTLVLTGREAAVFSLSIRSVASRARSRVPHPNERLSCRSLYRWVARDGDVLVSYAAFVLCHPPTRPRARGSHF